MKSWSNAFITITDRAFFPGTLATVNSLLNFHPAAPIYVVENDKLPLTAPQVGLLRQSPQITIVNSASLAREGRYINAWELKAYAAHDLCDGYDVVVGIDSDCVLCGPVDDQVRQAHESGGWLGGKDGGGADYSDDYRVYGMQTPAKNPKYMSTSLFFCAVTPENRQILAQAEHEGVWLELSDAVAATFAKLTKRTSPWENSLGMRFVPVAGTEVMFSLWHTRVEDFEAFVKATGHKATEGMESIKADGSKWRGGNWKCPGFAQTGQHPVCAVSWEDAQAFAQWLTEKERKEGRLNAQQSYRLPLDWEWSVAVGLEEPRTETPEENFCSHVGLPTSVYPWGSQWPPPPGAGNYAGEEVKDGEWPADYQVIAGFRDGYARTSPVGSFNANRFGLYDMGGNLWQWCEDYGNGQSGCRVLRGASWAQGDETSALSAYRGFAWQDRRADDVGFRLVLVGGQLR